MLYEELTYNIQGACFEVYKTMGCGFLESVYQECLEIELSDRGIPFEARKELELDYKGRCLKQRYVPDCNSLALCNGPRVRQPTPSRHNSFFAGAVSR
jgi:hypothetical protein